MAQATFTIDDFNLSSSWAYVADYDDDAGVRYDRTSAPSAKTADKTFTISGIDMSTVNSITLTWDVSAGASGSITTPSTGYGYSHARVYQGASTSGTYVGANTRKMDLTSYVGTSTSVTCRFYYAPSVPATYYDGSSNYGNGSCTGTVYFKNVTLTVVYGEERDDAGNGAWIGVDGIARKMKSMYVGVDGIARKVKAAWIGVNGVARLFYQAQTKLLASTGYYRISGEGSEISTEITVRSPSAGYAALVFPASTAFSSFSKATMYIYVTSNPGKLTMATLSGASNWLSYNAGLANTFEYTPSATGWQAIDITSALNTLISSNTTIPSNGLKVYFRGYGNCRIAGTSTTECAYIILE